MRAHEWIAAAYFGYLATAVFAVPLAPDRRRRIAVTATLVVAAVVAGARLGEGPGAVVLREWMPVAYLLFGYWLPALFVTAPDQAFERALLALDYRWFGRERLTTFAARAPRPVVELFELAYLFCYPIVPIGLACLALGGSHQDIERFWTAVLLAAFSCYGMLPWLPTRPPRAIEGMPVPSRSRVRRLNLRVLGRASVQLNTFPSGHAAVSWAIALAVGARLPWAGAILGLIAFGISFGSVVGRYHYAADALSGAALAVLGFVISRFLSA